MKKMIGTVSLKKKVAQLVASLRRNLMGWALIQILEQSQKYITMPS